MQTLSHNAVFSGCVSLPLARNASSARRQAPRRATIVAALPQAPKGVTQPPVNPVVPPPKFGFVDNAEVMNSRAAMIGFIALFIVEGIFGKGLLELMGVTVGKGLDIGF